MSTLGHHDHAFHAMGTTCRILVDGHPGERLNAAERLVHRVNDALSRFRPDSELCALNADPRAAVPASPLLRLAVGAGVWAARRTGGLVDPTVVAVLERAGYAQSRSGVRPASLPDALAAAPGRRPARPSARADWRRIRIDHAAGLVLRPPGVRLDTGGTGKGLAADLAARALSGAERFAVDCGGDIRLGGRRAHVDPFEVEVEHPLTGEVAHVLRVAGGAVATSGVGVRLWLTPGGGFAHHLLDPSNGRSAWTGLVGATALGRSALEAEVLAKAALLAGPWNGRRFLAEHGGVLFHDDGRVELAGPLARRLVVTGAA